MTRRPLSPEEREALRREDARYLLAPLDTRSGPRAAAAHLRHAIRQLRERLSPSSGARSPCAAAVVRLNALYDLTTPQHPAIVCKAGCSYCCVQNVTITAPEAFLLADTIRGDPERVAAVFAAEERLGGLSPAERIAQKAPCPLLVDHACGVYAVRPMACRAFVSTSLPACIATFTEGAPNDIPMPAASIDTLFAVRMLLFAALRHEGLDEATYELTPAVATALRDPAAEARWRAGEPVFAAITANPPIPKTADAEIGNLVEHVTGTV